MSDWHYFQEPQSGVYGRLRVIPGQGVGDGNQVYGVEIASDPEGPWIYNFDTAGQTPMQAVNRAKMRIRDRFRMPVD